MWPQRRLLLIQQSWWQSNQKDKQRRTSLDFRRDKHGSGKRSWSNCTLTRHEEAPDALILFSENPSATCKILSILCVIGTLEAAEARLPEAEFYKLSSVQSSVRSKPIGRHKCYEGQCRPESHDCQDRHSSVWSPGHGSRHLCCCLSRDIMAMTMDSRNGRRILVTTKSFEFLQPPFPSMPLFSLIHLHNRRRTTPSKVKKVYTCAYRATFSCLPKYLLLTPPFSCSVLGTSKWQRMVQQQEVESHLRGSKMSRRNV